MGSGEGVAHISNNKNSTEWIPLTDTLLPYQLHNIDLDKVIDCVSKKAQSSRNYKKTDELLLLIRNPHDRWEPPNNVEKQRISASKGENINSVWLFNWKMNTLPVQPDIIRIDY